MLVAHLILLGKLFYKTAVDVSNSLFSYRTVLLRFGTSDVVDADRNVLAGVYQWSKSHMYEGTCEWSTLNVITRILNWHRLFIGSHFKCCNVGVIWWCLKRMHKKFKTHAAVRILTKCGDWNYPSIDLLTQIQSWTFLFT